MNIIIIHINIFLIYYNLIFYLFNIYKLHKKNNYINNLKIIKIKKKCLFHYLN